MFGLLFLRLHQARSPSDRSNKTTLQALAAQDTGEVGSVLLDQDQTEILSHIFLNLFLCSGT